MHELSYQLMEEALHRVSQPKALVLDVGSLNINGSFRGLVEGKGWRYVGIDLVSGRNVDAVVDPYRYPFPRCTFDVVISGCTMEHVGRIWEWVPELARILKPGGLLAIVTHTNFYEHHSPDYWRLMPDGMWFLFDETGELKRYMIKAEETDIIGSALKRGG